MRGIRRAAFRWVGFVLTPIPRLASYLSVIFGTTLVGLIGIVTKSGSNAVKAALALVFVLMFVAGTRLMFERLRREAIIARLEMETPVSVSGRWYMRLRFFNDSETAGTFSAKVVSMDGMEPFGPELEWWIPWRHHPGRRNIPLLGKSNEMLDIAEIADVTEQYVRASRPGEWNPEVEFLVVAAEGAPHTRDAARISNSAGIDDLDGHSMVATCRVWHHETDQIVAERRVTFRLVLEGGSVVPKMEFDD